MTDLRENMSLQQTIPLDLKKQVEDIQTEVHITTDPPEDLDEEKKRWLIVGICLHSIISPLLRKYVDAIISHLYNSLVTSDSIDSQVYPTHLKKYPGKNRYDLNYESINNNKNKNKRSYDYRVTSHVDLSKLFLQPSMAHYSGIDGSCDSSALLGMVINISSFPSSVQTDAVKIRTDIRNAWAHCDFTEWSSIKYTDSLQSMEKLVKDLGLSNTEENTILGELNTWSTNGQKFLSGTRLGLEIVGEIRQQTHVLSSYVQTLCSEADSQFIKVYTELTSLENGIQERIGNLENAVADLANSQASGAMKKDAEKRILDNTLAQMLSTQLQLDTEVSDLQDEMEQVSLFIGKDVEKKEELKQIKVNVERMKEKDDNIEKDVKRCEENIDKLSERLNTSEVQMCERVESIKTKLENLHYLKQRLALQFTRMETFVIDGEKEKDEFVKDVESLCSQIQDSTSKHKERIESLEKKIKTLHEIQRDVDSLKLKSECIEEGRRKQDEECIPKNIRAQHGHEIKEWEHDEHTFVETRATRNVLGSLSIYNCIVVTGSSGCGKSSNIHHAALHLRHCFRYEIIPVSGPEDIIRYYDGNKRQVFVVDDIYGKETINKQTLQKWRDYLEKMDKIFKSNEKDVASDNDDTIVNISSSKLLISCRLHIFKESEFQRITLPTKKECNLLSSELCLLQEEKMLMLHKYLAEDIVNNVKSVMEDVDYFPLLCKLSKDKPSEEVKNLFKTPLTCIKNNIITIINENKDQFCALALCILFDGGFNTNWLKLRLAPVTEKDKIEDIVQEFDINVNKEMHRNSLKSGFLTLNGTYLKLRGTEYKIIHDKIYKMAAVICGQNLTECFIKYAPSLFIRDHFIFESLTEIDTCNNAIVLSKDQEEEYFERLLCDLEYDVITSTFHNKQLIHQSFMDELISFFGKSDHAKAVLKKIDTKGGRKKTHDCSFETQFDTTPLMETAYLGYFDMVHFLVFNVKCNVNQIDEKENSPLYNASRGGHLDVMKLLLENNADVYPFTNYFKENPFHATCRKGYTDLAKLLLQYNADVSKVDVDSRSPLYVACKGGFTDTVEFLLQNKADVSQCDTSGWSPLHIACINDNTRIVNMLLQNKANISQCNINRESPLYVACERGHIDTVHMLLENSADVSQCAFGMKSPLYVSCEKGHKDIVQMLLQKRADVSECDRDFQSPLYIACLGGYTDIVEILLHYNADVSQCDNHRRSPLCVACEKGYTGIVKLLLQYNADVSNTNTLNGKTPLYIACERKHTGIVQLLLKKGADVSQCNKRCQSSLYLACRSGYIETVNILLEYIADISLCDNKSSPLLAACERGYIDIVKLLLQYNANVSHCNVKKQAPLYIACEGGYKGIVRLLLGKGADVSQCDERCQSPLYVACMRGYTETVKLLLEYNSGVSPCDNKISPLFVACKSGYIDIVKCLLHYNFVVTYCDKKGSPLSVACNGGYTDIVKLLLQNNADVSQWDVTVGSPMFLACKGGYTDIVKLLLQYKADVSQCNSSGESPLYVACKHGNTDILKILLQNNANCSKSNIDGECPLFVACKHNNTDIVKILLQNNVYISERSINGESPLYVACDRGNTDIVQILLQNNAGVSQFTTDCKKSPLNVACEHRHIDIVKLLLHYNVGVTQCDKDGNFPLYVACEKKYTDIIELLLQNKADVSQIHIKNRQSVLHWACDTSSYRHSPYYTKQDRELYFEWHIEIVKLLLAWKADVNLRDKKFQTPLDIARKSQCAEIVDILEKNLLLITTS